MTGDSDGNGEVGGGGMGDFARNAELELFEMEMEVEVESGEAGSGGRWSGGDVVGDQELNPDPEPLRPGETVSTTAP
jgi:hypothetical protein